MKLRILFGDTERAPPIAWFWESNKPQFIGYHQIMQYGFFTSIQWQFDHEKEPSAFDLTNNEAYFRENPSCDYFVVKKIAEIVDQCDVFIAHNADRFDWRHFRARAIKHKIPIPRKPYIIDTLKEARKSWFPSNSLAGLAQHLNLSPKAKNDADTAKLISGPITERIDHIRKQTAYGIQDIPPLKELYERLKPYMERHPHIKEGKGVCCCYCGGQEYQNRGETYLKGLNQFRNWYFCKSCNRKFPGEVYHRNV